MITITYNCQRCGRDYTIDYKTESSAKRAHNRKYCPSCVTPARREKQREYARDLRPQSSPLQGIIHIDRACDRFLTSRGIEVGSDAPKKQLILPAREQPSDHAVRYGEIAAQRYLNYGRNQS